MLKHLPEGLTPFERCGFDRRPLFPLEGERVQVFCRCDETPLLTLWVDEKQSLLHPHRLDERHFRFDLGAFSWGEQVAYQLTADGETSPRYAFEPQREEIFRSPRGLLAQGTTACLVFDRFHVLFDASNDLTVTVDTGTPPPLPPQTQCTLPLPENFSLRLNECPNIWELKRSSSADGLAISAYHIRWGKHGGITQICQTGVLGCRRVWGTGERFHRTELSQSGTNGRVVEKFTQQGDQTYLPIPFFMTDTGLGCFRDSAIPAEMQFAPFSVSQLTQGSRLSRDVYFFGTPAQILRRFVFLTGQPVMPPHWAFGLWISANGWNCDREVDAQLAALKQYDYPADVMVLEAWSDERTFYRWNDSAHWKDPVDTVCRIREAGLHLILWQIPIIKYEWDGDPGEALLQDEKEAIEKGFCILREDGSPYRITENWFHNSLLPDFTNPEAVKWWFTKRAYLLEMGVEGFKTDGGEFLFDHAARLHNSMTGLEAHNLYPAQYIGAYHQFMQQHRVKGVTFSRADYTGAHTRPLHWAGDQLSTWQELTAQMNAGLSAGLSGVLFWGFDIGGFAGELPDGELYLRATALACFCPIMQWHAEPRSGQFYATHADGFVNDRSPWNLAEKWQDERILEIGTYFARLRRRLRPYLVREAQYCVENGRPLMAHLCLDFPEDETALDCGDQYMLGRKLLIAPILNPGQRERRVYLPRGTWRDAFTRDVYEGGRWICAPCALDQIPVYERCDADA